MKKIIGILIAIVLVVGLAVGIREVMAQHAQEHPRTAQSSHPAKSDQSAASKSESKQKHRAKAKQTSKKHSAASSKKPTTTGRSSDRRANKKSHSNARHHAPASSGQSKSSKHPSSKAKKKANRQPTSKAKSQKKSSRQKRVATAKAKPKSAHHSDVVGKAYVKVSGYKKQFYAGFQKIIGKATAFSLLMKTHLKVSYTKSPDVYVSAINGLKENDIRPGSGWMYSVNGKYVDKSAGEKRVKPGDRVHWYFSVDGYKP